MAIRYLAAALALPLTRPQLLLIDPVAVMVAMRDADQLLRFASVLATVAMAVCCLAAAVALPLVDPMAVAHRVY